MGGLLHLVQRGKDGWGRSPPRSILAVPTVTAHPSTASVPMAVLLYSVCARRVQCTVQCMSVALRF